LRAGTFGICEVCHEAVDAGSLLANPLARICLDHLSPSEARMLEADLEMAARIQRALLPPRNLSVHGWEVHYHYEPLGLVSGDFCDLVAGAPVAGELFFLLGDVSGKGVAASLLMSHLHAMFRSLAAVAQPLEQMMALANRLFCQGTIDGQFATLVAGRADARGRMELAGAGHPPALLLRRSGISRIESGGFPLGMFGESHFPSQALEFAPGDTLLFYSDGVTESRNAAGEEYGVERLAQFSERNCGRSPAELVGSCVAELRAFSGSQPRSDDVTLMALRRAA